MHCALASVSLGKKMEIVVTVNLFSGKSHRCLCAPVSESHTSQFGHDSFLELGKPLPSGARACSFVLLTDLPVKFIHSQIWGASIVVWSSVAYGALPSPISQKHMLYPEMGRVQICLDIWKQFSLKQRVRPAWKSQHPVLRSEQRAEGLSRTWPHRLVRSYLGVAEEPRNRPDLGKCFQKSPVQHSGHHFYEISLFETGPAPFCSTSGLPHPELLF